MWIVMYTEFDCFDHQNVASPSVDFLKIRAGY